MNILLIYLLGFFVTAVIMGFIVGANVGKHDPDETILYLLGVVFWPIGLLMILMVGCLEFGRILRAKLWP